MNDSLYVQYGCGLEAPVTWLNFDSSPTLSYERLPLIGRLYTRNSFRFPTNVRFGDIVKGLPVAVNSCSGVYCAHVLEHLSLEDFRKALRNTYEILKPGAVFRLVLPDLQQAIQHYQQSSAKDAALTFMRETSLGHERRPKNLTGFITSWLGSSHHLWMWDYPAMDLELSEAGFIAVRRASFGDCPDPRFQEVEDITRWTGCLGVECHKPG